MRAIATDQPNLLLLVAACVDLAFRFSVSRFRFPFYVAIGISGWTRIGLSGHLQYRKFLVLSHFSSSFVSIGISGWIRIGLSGQYQYRL